MHWRDFGAVQQIERTASMRQRVQIACKIRFNSSRGMDAADAQPSHMLNSAIETNVFVCFSDQRPNPATPAAQSARWCASREGANQVYKGANATAYLADRIRVGMSPNPSVLDERLIQTKRRVAEFRRFRSSLQISKSLLRRPLGSA